MKRILLLSDETSHPTQLLQDEVRTTVTLHQAEAVAGCTCDRWGHPCPGSVERNIQPNAERPMAARLEK